MVIFGRGVPNSSCFISKTNIDLGETSPSSMDTPQDKKKFMSSHFPSLTMGSSELRGPASFVRLVNPEISTSFTTGAIMVSDNLPLQKVSLTHAVAPLLSTPIAPFAKNERKRALINASYYSECFLKSVPAFEADMAAIQAQKWYEKWCVNAKRSKTNEEKQNGAKISDGFFPERKKLKLDQFKKSRGAQESKEIVSMTLSSPACVSSEDESTILESCDESNSSHSIGNSKNVSPVQESVFALADVGRLEIAKAAMLSHLKATGGDTSTEKFRSCLNVLASCYSRSQVDGRFSTSSSSSMNCGTLLDGTWLTISKADYHDCLGRNERGQSLYTLGRMSFDMFKPSNLRCAIQDFFNKVSICSEDHSTQLPDMDQARRSRLRRNLIRSLKRDKKSVDIAVREYDTIINFTIEANQTKHGGTGVDKATNEATTSEDFVLRKPIKALLTNHCYCIPDPKVTNRLSLWFAGGTLKILEENPSELEKWKKLFHAKEEPLQVANALASRLLVGARTSETMLKDGTITYELDRPIGGHGQVYNDILYSDGTLRIVRGHNGSIYVFTLVPAVFEKIKF